MESILDSHLAKEVSPLCKLFDETVVICVAVDVIVKKKTERMAILATNFSLCFLERTSKSKWELQYKCHYGEVSLIALESPKKFGIDAGKRFFSIEHKNGTLLFKGIVQLMKSVIPKKNMPKVSYDNGIVGNIEYLPNSFSSRVAFNFFASKKKIPDGLIDEIDKLVKHSSIEIDFGFLPEFAQYIEFLVESIEVLPQVQSVVIPKLGKKPNWSPVATLLRNNLTLKHIKTAETIDSGFKQVIEAVKSNKDSPLIAFTFQNTEIKSDSFSMLRTFFENTQISSLTINEAITSENLSKLLKENPQIFERIEVLSISLCQNLDVSLLLKSLPVIKHCRLVQCNINVSAMMGVIGNTELESLTIIEGYSRDPFPSGSILPRMLSSICIQKIQWEKNTIIQALDTFIGHSPINPYILDFSFIYLKADYWMETLNHFNQIAPSSTLSELIWHENKIKNEFFNHCEQVPNLTRLSLCGLPKNNDVINKLASSLLKLKNLKVLHVIGSREAFFGHLISMFLNGIQMMTSLEELDVSGHSFGDEGLIHLAKFLVNSKNIKCVEFSNNNITSKEAWVQFFETLINRGPALYFPFPTNDLSVLKNKKLIHKKEIDSLRDFYATIINGTATNVVTDTINSNEVFANEDGENEDSESQNSEPSPIEWDLHWPISQLPDTTQYVQQILDFFTLDLAMSKFSST